MSTRVLLTIDTELTWRHHQPDGWEENFARSYRPAGVGIFYQLRVLAAHGLKACFFVDPMPALLFGLDPVKRMVEPILAAGQEVQLHLHPIWAALARGCEEETGCELKDYDLARQRELIATARDLLMAAGAPAPIAFRAGSYAANGDTLAALSALGITYDSSHNGSQHPRLSATPLPPAQLAPVPARGVIEVPVSQIEEAPGRLRHLQICAVSSAELEAALLHAADAAHPVVTIVSHSFELATRDGRRANRLVQKRFVRLCSWLERRREALPTAHFEDLEALPLNAPARPLATGPLRRVRRLAEQLWGDARYERPAESLTAVSGSGIAGLEALLHYVG